MLRQIDPDTVGFLIADVSRLLRAEFDKRTSSAGIGLTPGQARALANVARAGSIRQTKLAERMGIEAMTLSSYLDRLEERSLIRRIVDPTDRRAKLVDVTEEAQTILEEVDNIGAELREDIAALLGYEQLEAVRSGLKQVRAVLIDMRPECAIPALTA